MSYEKSCSSCVHFHHEGPCDRGACDIGVRNGVTYGRYICTNWRADAGGSSDTVDEQRPAGGDAPHTGVKKPHSDAGDSVQTDVIRDDRADKEFAKKGVNYVDAK